ncbi:hypothetical protein [Leifsonia sp. Leaf264]|uniref:hypothetical protein n=1 Tax=Leifsonia sp. Leaf264 TaxID=1736314 RepID=UPI0006FAF932|nr:hypothetical protein [Leifsonia sp. Leaf264]KQP01597.1 hypothetical protein ASF30_03095 [Leifsonia sp. Leaf264]
MNDDNELDPVARLRAADPASEVEPRAGFIDDVVVVATGEHPAGEPASPAAGESEVEPTPVVDLGTERARRSRRWIPIVAVAASLVVFGSAGYAVGASTGAPSTVAEGAAPPISLQGASRDSGSEAGVGSGSEPNAAAGQAPSAQKMAGGVDSMYAYGYGRNSFSSSGLSTATGTAAGYGFDARAASNAETVAALAAALGVDGTPELKDGAWIVGSRDGTAPSLTVSLDGLLSFSYSDPLIVPWPCVDGAEPAQPCEQTGTGVVPTEEEAIGSIRSLIEAAGLDPEGFEYTSETWEGSLTRTAQAWPVVDGQRIDQPWSIELASDGIFSAYGPLATLVALGDYDVVSEQQAFERLSDPRFGAQMTNLPIALRDPAAGAAPADAPQEWVPPTEPPAAPSAGAPVSWPVTDVAIVSARLGLASQWQPDGSVLVVPAYEFTDEGGGTWSVIAVADSKLDFATQ